MAKQHSAYLVILDESLHADVSQQLIQALKWMKGVLDVQPVETDHVAEQIATSRIKRELREKLQEILR